MLTLKEAAPVKVVVGALWADAAAWDRAVTEMRRVWGPIDVWGEAVPFTFTDYYEEEMGPDLQRQFVSFADLRAPASLSELKIAANGIEERLSQVGRRTVNLDVGTIDYHRVVLASTKEGRHKIYVGGGIWADLTLLYSSGAFQPLPWTFLDLTSGVYDAFFCAARAAYKQALRNKRETWAC